MLAHDTDNFDTQRVQDVHQTTYVYGFCLFKALLTKYSSKTVAVYVSFTT